MMRTHKLPALILLLLSLLSGTAWLRTAPVLAQAKPFTASLPGSGYAITQVKGLADDRIWTVDFDRQGRAWVGTYAGGAAVQDGDTWRTYVPEDGLASSSVNAFLFDPDGKIWVGTDRGLNLIEEGAVTAEYGFADGMASSGVEDLVVDADGNLWAAHLAEGVSRFDGTEWTAFTTGDGLADNWVHSAALDAEGQLWFATNGGASLYDSETWTTYDTSAGLADNTVFAAAATADGHAWFGTAAGLSEYDGTWWISYLPGQPINDIAVGPNGTVWAVGGDKVYRYHAENLSAVETAHFEGQDLRSVAVSPSGEVWVGSFGDGITVLTPQPGAATTLWLGTQSGVTVMDGEDRRYYGVEDGLADPDVRAILIDREGRKWFGTAGGASMYDGVAWTSYYPSYQSISSNYVHDVAVDPNGRTWFLYGDRGLGASVKNGEEWQQFTETDGLGSDRVYSIGFGRKGEIWLGTARGVSQWDGSGWSDLSTQVGAPAGAITAMAVSPAGYLWAGYEGGVARYDGQSWQSFGIDEGLTIALPEAIVFDQAGRVWVGAAPRPGVYRDSGLFVYEGGGWHSVAAKRTNQGSGGPAAQPLGDWVTGLAAAPDGALWVGALSYPMAKPLFTVGGVSVFDATALPPFEAAAGEDSTGGQSSPVEIATPWTIHTPHDGLISDYVTAVAVDAAGRVWIGTQNGLSIYDGTSWRTYTSADGLPHNNISALSPTPGGGMWVSTNGGGAVLMEDGEWRNVTTIGLADRQVNSIAEGPDGSLWFATAGGVSRFDGEAWTTYTMLDGLADNYSAAAAVDGAGSVWVGSGSGGYTGGGMSRFDGEAWTTYPLMAQTFFNNVAALSVAGDGVAWAVAYHPQQFSSQSSLFRFDGQQWIAEGGAGPLNDDLVNAFAIGADGGKWFGTDGSYDGKTLVLWTGTEWHSYRHGDGQGPVRSLALDSGDHGWYGTDSGLYEFWAEGVEVEAQRVEGQRKEVVQAIALERLLPRALGEVKAPIALSSEGKMAGFRVQGSVRP